MLFGSSVAFLNRSIFRPLSSIFDQATDIALEGIFEAVQTVDIACTVIQSLVFCDLFGIPNRRAKCIDQALTIVSDIIKTPLRHQDSSSVDPIIDRSFQSVVYPDPAQTVLPQTTSNSGDQGLRFAIRIDCLLYTSPSPRD